VIVYVVDIEVDDAAYGEYCAWLREHVREMIALPGFAGAEVFERREPAAAAGRRAVSVHYRIATAADLDRYLREHAPRMRADGTSRFPGKFSASRQILATLAGR